MSKEEILKAAMELDWDERMDLADELFASLPARQQEEIDKAWLEESEARLDALERGETQALPGEEVFEQLRAKYSK